MNRKLFVTSFVAAVLMAMQTGRALACAVCLSGADDEITGGYNASVLFLMAMPYVVAASIAAGLFFAYRRAAKRRQEAEEDSIVQLAWKQEESSR